MRDSKNPASLNRGPGEEPASTARTGAWLHFSPSSLARKLVILAIVAWCAILIYWLGTAFVKDIGEAEIRSWSEFRPVLDQLDDQYPSAGLRRNLVLTRTGEHELNPLFYVQFLVRARPSEDNRSQKFEVGPHYVRLNFPRLVGALAFLAGLIILERHLKYGDGEEPQQRPEGAPKDSAPSLVQLAEMELAEAERLCRRVYIRSTFMLRAGLTVALAGVGTIYFLLPSNLPVNDPGVFMMHLARPIAIVLYIEAIALFLLRQYRASVDDFKYFNILRMKRADLLAAIHLLDQEDPEQRLDLSNRLLSEPWRIEAAGDGSKTAGTLDGSSLSRLLAFLEKAGESRGRGGAP